MSVVATNKYAKFNYFLLETYEAGIVLSGSEIKSVRQNGMTLNESFILVGQNKVVLKNSFIKPYQTTNGFSLKADRDRDLLLHQNEILKIRQAVDKKGLTIVPVKAYLKGNLLKLEIALAKGKKLFDKKQDKKEKDIARTEARDLLSKGV